MVYDIRINYEYSKGFGGKTFHSTEQAHKFIKKFIEEHNVFVLKVQSKKNKR